MHSNGTLPLDAPLAARCGYSLRAYSHQAGAKKLKEHVKKDQINGKNQRKFSLSIGMNTTLEKTLSEPNFVQNLEYLQCNSFLA